MSSVNKKTDVTTLLAQRKVTRKISDYLAGQLNTHLSALTPLCNPRTVLGEHVRGGTKLTGRGSEVAFRELKNLYGTINKKHPFNLRSEFDSPISVLSATPEVMPRTYKYRADSGSESKTVTVTSPLQWVLSYKGFGADRLRELIAKQSKTAGNDLEECVLHCLVMHAVLGAQSKIPRLLEALRFPLRFERAEEFGELPLPVISCPLSTSLPVDEVIIESTELSGTSAFEEVVDVRDIANISDPLVEKLVSLTEGTEVEGSSG